MAKKRKSRGGRGPRRKGFGYERELVNQFEEAGLEAKRAYGSNGEALGAHETVDLRVEDHLIQAKRKKSIASYLKPNEHQDCVAVREDGGKTLIVMEIGTYIDLLTMAGVNGDDEC